MKLPAWGRPTGGGRGLAAMRLNALVRRSPFSPRQPRHPRTLLPDLWGFGASDEKEAEPTRADLVRVREVARDVEERMPGAIARLVRLFS